MAELVDALDSKSGYRKVVQVRFLFWAQQKKKCQISSSRQLRKKFDTFLLQRTESPALKSIYKPVVCDSCNNLHCKKTLQIQLFGTFYTLECNIRSPPLHSGLHSFTAIKSLLYETTTAFALPHWMIDNTVDISRRIFCRRPCSE